MIVESSKCTSFESHPAHSNWLSAAADKRRVVVSSSVLQLSSTPAQFTLLTEFALVSFSDVDPFSGSGETFSCLEAVAHFRLEKEDACLISYDENVLRPCSWASHPLELTSSLSSGNTLGTFLLGRGGRKEGVGRLFVPPNYSRASLFEEGPSQDRRKRNSNFAHLWRPDEGGGLFLRRAVGE
ncbi:hypothetical protein TNCT_578401 [Trichonephila clavata]|uniref:Uncharacterized protein n=1 Tax=Trichonephila clavata TaxID=2740835 RepID=A0A8X6FBR2_TRICU|nr:hypothetical protein TNCT_578401 [Trichonephila clavata]